MQGKNFKDLLGLNYKMKWSKKFMHYYEKKKNLRIAVGVGVGVFLSINFIAVYPGHEIIFQKEIKHLVARYFIQYNYLSILYSEAVFLNTKNCWEKSLQVGQYYVAKFRKDVLFIQGIQNPWLVAQSVDMISSVILESKQERGLFFSALKSIGIVINEVLMQNPKLFMNQDLKDSLLNPIVKIRENYDFRDKLGATIGNDEWNNLFSLFLLICELGTEEKIQAYKELQQILQNHDEIWEIAVSEKFFLRVFQDSVSENMIISQLSLNILQILSKDFKVAKSLVSYNLVYNLITKVKDKHKENIELISQIIDNLAFHGKEIWVDPDLQKEKARIKGIKKTCEVESLSKLTNFL